MITTLSSFTVEQLSSLKFKELQKLSAQFHVNKRWAKKQELIENLVALKKKIEAAGENKEEEQEWRDASTVFSDLKVKTENETNRRLTYNVQKGAEHHDSRLTFEVPQNGKNLLSEAVNSRETYDILPDTRDFGTEFLKESRATFEVPPQKKLTDSVDSRATFNVCKSKKILLEENVISENNLHEGSTIKKNKEIDDFEPSNMEENNKLDSCLKKGKQDKEKKNSEMKMLTIPHARVTRRTRAGEASKNESLPIKMSKKSINIKKSTRIPISKTDLLKSPSFASVKKSFNKKTIIQSLPKSQSQKIVQSKVPIRLEFREGKSKPMYDSNKENLKKILKSHISETGDEAVNKKQNLTKVNFRTPPLYSTKSSRVEAFKKTPLRKNPDGKMNCSGVQTPGNKVVTKPITATKMPDFSKIHKRQFEQMDSLHDYIKKKEDRIRKLFGTPQPGQQLHNLNKSAPLFQFQSTATANKENKESESSKNISATPLKKKENDSKFTQKEAFKSKVRTDIKDKNRSHIHGVRTNKRFELQMKFRNI